MPKKKTNVCEYTSTIWPSGADLICQKDTKKVSLKIVSFVKDLPVWKEIDVEKGTAFDIHQLIESKDGKHKLYEFEYDYQFQTKNKNHYDTAYYLVNPPEDAFALFPNDEEEEVIKGDAEIVD